MLNLWLEQWGFILTLFECPGKINRLRYLHNP